MTDIAWFYITADEEYLTHSLWLYLTTKCSQKVEVIIEPRLRTCEQARWLAHQRAWKLAYSNNYSISLVIEDSLTAKDFNWNDQLQQLIVRLNKQLSWQICALDGNYYDKLKPWEGHLNKGRLNDTKAYLISWVGVEAWRENPHPQYIIDYSQFFIVDNWFSNRGWWVDCTWSELNSLTWIGIIGLVLIILLLVYFIYKSAPPEYHWIDLLYFK